MECFPFVLDPLPLGVFEGVFPYLTLGTEIQFFHLRPECVHSHGASSPGLGRVRALPGGQVWRVGVLSPCLRAAGAWTPLCPLWPGPTVHCGTPALEDCSSQAHFWAQEGPPSTLYLCSICLPPNGLPAWQEGCCWELGRPRLPSPL